MFFFLPFDFCCSFVRGLVLPHRHDGRTIRQDSVTNARALYRVCCAASRTGVTCARILSSQQSTLMSWISCFLYVRSGSRGAGSVEPPQERSWWIGPSDISLSLKRLVS